MVRSKIFVFLASLLLAMVIGGIRYKTGHELALSLFYLFPVCIVSWRIGRWPGIFMSVVCASSWLAADLTMLDRFSNKYIPYINETFRLIVFIIVVHIIVALQRALEKQAELARIDPLTGIANRRAFIELAGRELNEARRFNYPVSMLYIDIDHFKRLNDSYGHHEGDMLLCAVAKTLKISIRSIDVAARLGGDEFGIMISRGDEKASRYVTDKIHEKLLLVARQNNWRVTFSIGLAIYETAPQNIYEMMQKADSLMYMAKKNGNGLIEHELITGKKNGLSGSPSKQKSILQVLF